MITAAPSRRIGLTQPIVVVVVLAVVIAVVVMAFVLQSRAEHGALTPVSGGKNVLTQREIDKLDAEIRQIRSDTSGSLFWLKLTASLSRWVQPSADISSARPALRESAPMRSARSLSSAWISTIVRASTPPTRR